jgi:aspartate aminotransferase-like enzyme
MALAEVARMLRIGQYVFKCAETRQELEQVHRLNYRTFVSEIPQHEDHGDGLLIDKFHNKNQYIVVLRGSRVVGMLGVHNQPPYSVADRLPDPAVLNRSGTRPIEVRLLAIEPEERNKNMFFGLMHYMYRYAEERGFTHMYISAIEERLQLYKRLGFKVLGPAVPGGNARFVPMVLTLGDLPGKARRTKQLWETHLERVTPRGTQPVCLLPGPVTTAAAVRQAFHQPPIYHRGPEFINRFMKVRRTLASMANGRDVAILNGSGTLANETVAATLAADPRGARGVLLINGEFGRRLARQATRFGLQPRLLEWEWGQPWDLDQVDAALADEPAGSWVWGVHQESSTGVLNDLTGLVRIARRREVRVCADCISSLGAVPLDLRDVYLATGSTGKALGSYAGAALIFADSQAIRRIDRSRMPSYFDLVAALDSEGPCYTFPSPTLLALEAALEQYVTPAVAQERYEEYARLGRYVREQLRDLGLEPLAREEWACPVVTTFTPPNDDSSAAFVDRCRRWGFIIGGQSGYLAEKRLVQIATMGAVAREECAALFKHLHQLLVGAALEMCLT